jgi:hypothetical protein
MGMEYRILASSRYEYSNKIRAVGTSKVISPQSVEAQFHIRPINNADRYISIGRANAPKEQNKQIHLARSAAKSNLKKKIKSSSFVKKYWADVDASCDIFGGHWHARPRSRNRRRLLRSVIKRSSVLLLVFNEPVLNFAPPPHPSPASGPSDAHHLARDFSSAGFSRPGSR